MVVQLCPATIQWYTKVRLSISNVINILLTGMVDELIMPARQHSAAAAAGDEWAQAIVEVSLQPSFGVTIYVYSIVRLNVSTFN